ncbi:MAG: transglutaminase-like domain-containing protein, partial [Candidatus Aenigmatarchaeota archaeon]
MRFKIFLFVLAFLLASTSVYAINAKSIDYMKVEVTETGTLTPIDVITEMNLEVYIPAQYESLDVQAESWSFINDSYGNNMVRLSWKNPLGPKTYNVKTLVNSNAKHLATNVEIADNPELTKEMEGIEFTDYIRKKAYPYEKTIDNIVELAKWVHDYIEYDTSYVNEILNVSEILRQRKGVCVEYATLLTSLLRVSGIPVRFAAGYAYSSMNENFIGHSWIEVPLANGQWLGIDPTWLEAGYIDATHIKTASLPTNHQLETLTYRGTGEVRWDRGETNFNIIDTQEKSKQEISVVSEQSSFKPGYGYVVASIDVQECNMFDISANSCVDNNNKKLLDIYEQGRILWLCNNKEDIYWFFSISGKNYACPISIFDQGNSRTNAEIEVSNEKTVSQAAINGPDTVGVNELFILEAYAGSNFFFYSSKFGKHSASKWELSISKPGNYIFYLYSDGSLDMKNVSVVEKKEFNLDVIAPANVTLGMQVPVRIVVKNLMNETKDAMASIEFSGNITRTPVVIEPSQSKELALNLTTTSAGSRKLVVTVSANTLI